MNTSNSPWGADWEKWFKSPWITPQAGGAIPQDPAAVFASLMSMWSGSHPLITMPAGSMAALMKDAGIGLTDLMSQAASHQAILISGWQAAFAAFTKDINAWVPSASDSAEADAIESLDELVARWT